jgi:hypothetical protein
MMAARVNRPLHHLVVCATVAVAGTALARPAPTRLADFFPATVEGRAGVNVYPPKDRYRAEADYELEGGPDADGAAHPRKLRFELTWATDPRYERSRFYVRAAGQTRSVEGNDFKGFKVQGRFVERAFRGGRSAGRALLADRMTVEITVEPARDPDEALRWMRELDLAGIERFARATGPASRGHMPRGMVESLRRELDQTETMAVVGALNGAPDPHAADVLRRSPNPDGGAPSR